MLLFKNNLGVPLLFHQDKEYPVKAMKIANLQKEMQTIKISNEVSLEQCRFFLLLI